jgi:PAS domain S-box-containing protein
MQFNQVFKKRKENMNNSIPKNILLVDDEAILGITLSMQLREYGYKVVLASSGQKAIDAMNHKDCVIDLILMDINLNEKLDGTEIAKIILKDHDIPLLFHSSHTERDIVGKTENITSYGYVVKNGITVLDASIKSAFRLYDANKNNETQKLSMDKKDQKIRMYEKRYRRLFEAAKDGILILSAETGMITDVNPFLVDMLGYSKDELLEKNIWDIGPFKNIQSAKILFEELQEKEYVRYEDMPLETAHGKLIHVEFVSNVYLVDNEKVIQCNIRDITARRKYEKNLTDDIGKKDALIREIQHRIKNSFAMIISLMRLRSNTSKSEEVKTALDELALRVRSMSDLYTLLNDSDNFFEIKLNTYCDKVIESFNSISKELIINKTFQDITVSSSKAATIGIIVVELISNAVKYAFQDSPGIINIELKMVDSKIELTVEDNGIGLPHGTDLTNMKSLGLRLVYAMVEQLGGKISLIQGKGAKFVIILPKE